MKFLRDGSINISHHNFQKLTIAIFKVKLGVAPALAKNAFQMTENLHGFRNDERSKAGNVYLVRYDIESSSYINRFRIAMLDNIKNATL